VQNLEGGSRLPVELSGIQEAGDYGRLCQVLTFRRGTKKGTGGKKGKTEGPQFRFLEKGRERKKGKLVTKEKGDASSVLELEDAQVFKKRTTAGCGLLQHC